MVNLEFYDTHNMVAYLEKPEGSEGFHKIVDYLNASHIRASKGYTGEYIPLFSTMLVQGLIVQDEGSTVPVESHHTPTGASSTLQPQFSPTLRIPIRQETEVPQPSSPPHTNVADEAASTGVDVRHRGAVTTITSLDAGQGSSNIDKIPSMPYDLPLPRVHTLGSDEGRMQHNELMDLVTKLSNRVATLETYLEQTKKVYGAAYTKLIKKMGAQTQGRYGQDMEYDTSVFDTTTAGAEISTTSPEVKTVGVSVDDTAAKTLVYIRRSESKAKDKAMRLQDEIDKEERQMIARVHETTSSFNIKEWEDIQARFEADEELAVRLQAKERENYTKAEKARMLQLRGYSFDEIKTLFETTMRRVNTFVPMDTKDRRGVPELVADSSQATIREDGGTKRVEEEELGHQSSKKQKSGELSQEELQQLEVYTEDSRKYWKIIRVGNHTKVYQFFENMLQTFDRDDLVKIWSLVQERFNSTEPTEDKEREILVELKRLFEPDVDDELWKS
nr:hypothetical protein [Tanacetum cinerariifolium]